MTAILAMFGGILAWPWSMIAVIIGFGTFCMILYVNFIRPKLRRRKLRKPARAFFIIPKMIRQCDYAEQEMEEEHKVKQVVLPTNSEIVIHLVYTPRLVFQTKEVAFGCEVLTGDPRKPAPIEYDNPFILQGRNRVVPGPDNADYIDIDGNYHATQDKTWSVGTDRAYAFKMRTSGPGTYKAITTFSGDEREGKADDLTIRIEDYPKTPMRCVLCKHWRRPCYRHGIQPKPRREGPL